MQLCKANILTRRTIKCYKGNPDIARQVMGNKSEADECSHNHHTVTEALVVE